MKCTKFLSSIAALALVISFGACSSEDDEEIENSPVEPGESIVEEYEASNPTELVEKAYYTGNYSVEIEYSYYKSNDTMTGDELDAAMEAYNGYGEDYEALEKYYALQEDVTLQETLVYDIYYDRDYLLLVEYVVISGQYYLYLLDFLVNCDDGLWEYWTYDGENWSYYPSYYYALYGVTIWEDYFYSLFYAYETGITSHFIYYSEYDTYDFDDWLYSIGDGTFISQQAALWFCSLGGDQLFYDSAYYYAFYYYTHYGTVFSKANQSLTSYYWFGTMYYTDDTHEDLYFGEEDIYMTVYDVGKTDESEFVYYYHDIFQSQINGR